MSKWIVILFAVFIFFTSSQARSRENQTVVSEKIPQEIYILGKEKDFLERYQVIFSAFFAFMIGVGTICVALSGMILQSRKEKIERKSRQRAFFMLLYFDINYFISNLQLIKSNVYSMNSDEIFDHADYRALQRSSDIALPRTVIDDWEKLSFVNEKILRNIHLLLASFRDLETVIRESLGELDRKKGGQLVLFGRPEDEPDTDDVGELLDDIIDHIDNVESVAQKLQKLVRRELREMGGLVE